MYNFDNEDYKLKRVNLEETFKDKKILVQWLKNKQKSHDRLEDVNEVLELELLKRQGNTILDAYDGDIISLKINLKEARRKEELLMN